MSKSLVERWIAPEIRAAQTYAVPDARGLIKLDAMENPYPLAGDLRAVWLQSLQAAELNRYPDPHARDLCAALRVHLRLDEKIDLLLGNGSDEIIQILALAMRGERRVILAPEPTFVMYKVIADWLGYAFAGVPLRAADFSLDLPAMLAAIEQHQPALIFLACPNNPTGNLFAREDVHAILAAASGLVIVDEAYFPFCGETWLQDLPQHENLLVMQTLSKAGLAGLRVGYLAGARDWLAQFHKVRLPYNINVLSQLSARFALEHADVFARQAAEIVLERARMLAALRAMPAVRVWESRANFLLLRVPPDARAVHARLREQGVLVKCLHDAHPHLHNCLRVTIGTAAENAAFLEALRTALT